MTDGNGEIRRLPAWREAEHRFLEARYKAGDEISDETLYEWFGLEMPTKDMPVGKADPLRLRFVSNFDKLKQTLLCDHQIWLVRSDKQKGYRVVPNTEQISLGYQDAMDIVAKGIRTGVNVIAHTRDEGLTDQQKVQKSNALNQLGILSHSFRLTRKCPRLGEKKKPKQIEG